MLAGQGECSGATEVPNDIRQFISTSNSSVRGFGVGYGPGATCYGSLSSWGKGGSPSRDSRLKIGTTRRTSFLALASVRSAMIISPALRTTRSAPTFTLSLLLTTPQTRKRNRDEEMPLRNSSRAVNDGEKNHPGSLSETSIEECRQHGQRHRVSSCAPGEKQIS